MVLVEFHSLLLEKDLQSNAPELFKFAQLSYEEKLAFRRKLFAEWQSRSGPAFRYFLRESNQHNQWAECHQYVPGRFAFINSQPHDRQYLKFSPFCQ